MLCSQSIPIVCHKKWAYRQLEFITYSVHVHLVRGNNQKRLQNTEKILYCLLLNMIPVKRMLKQKSDFLNLVQRLRRRNHRNRHQHRHRNHRHTIQFPITNLLAL